MLPEPSDKIQHVGVSPHPLRETFKATERFHAVAILAYATDEPVDAISVRPVRFHGDGVKTSLLNQPLRNLSALPVKLVCAMTSFTQQDKPGIANEGQSRIVIARGTGEGFPLHESGPAMNS